MDETKEMSKERKSTMFRIDNWLYEKIEKMAEEEERTVNQQVIYILKKYMKEYEKNVNNLQ